MTWRLAEWIFYNQGYTGRNTEFGRKRGEAIYSTTLLVGDPEEEGYITVLGLLPKEQKVQISYWAHQQ